MHIHSWIKYLLSTKESARTFLGQIFTIHHSWIRVWDCKTGLMHPVQFSRLGTLVFGTPHMALLRYREAYISYWTHPYKSKCLKQFHISYILLLWCVPPGVPYTPDHCMTYLHHCVCACAVFVLIFSLISTTRLYSNTFWASSLAIVQWHFDNTLYIIKPLN